MEKEGEGLTMLGSELVLGSLRRSLSVWVFALCSMLQGRACKHLKPTASLSPVSAPWVGLKLGSGVSSLIDLLVLVISGVTLLFLEMRSQRPGRPC